jgi:parallel beta-helix repeat protein
MTGLMQRRTRRLFEGVGGLCTAFAVVAVVLPGSGQARVSQVSCGATITTDTQLDSDLANCPNVGIVIGADNITLDLNGQTVSGDGQPVVSCPEGESCDIGIDNTAGHTNVTIRGGAVRGFDVGVLVLGARENRLHRLASANNSSFGLIVGDSTTTRIDHNSSVDDGISGIVVSDSQHLRIEHNAITGTSGYAVPVFGSSHNRFEHNLLMNDQHGFLLADSNENAGSDDNEIRGNRLAHGPEIEVNHSSDNRVRENVLTDPGDGILLIESHRTQVSGNAIHQAGIGFSEPGGFGILLDGADDNILQRNALSDGKGPAIFVTTLESQGTSDRNVFSDNVANDNLGDGILVDAGATGTLLERNTANGNGDDGIDVDAPGTSVTRNTANDNRDLGIEAVPGVIDGGGNRASGNGNVLQCTDLACS